jgi:hypothetical protein
MNPEIVLIYEAVAMGFLLFLFITRNEKIEAR